MQRTPRTRLPTPSTTASERPVPPSGLQVPKVRKLGTLPAVTSAFGGSFTP